MMVGARVAYLLSHWNYYQGHRAEILDLGGGGFSLLGGLVLGALAVSGLLIRYKLPVLKTLDVVVPPLVLGLVVSRVGCFLDGCCYGMLTDLPWGVKYPEEIVHRHPIQLYEAGALLALFFGLAAFQRRRMPPGALMLSSGFLYGLWRWVIGPLRADHWVLGGGINAYQKSGLLLMVVFGLFWLVRLWVNRRSSIANLKSKT